jgi:hypothetical protein
MLKTLSLSLLGRFGLLLVILAGWERSPSVASAFTDQPTRVVRYEARMEVLANGDLSCEETVQFPTQAYLQAKQQFGGPVQLFRAIQQTFGWSIVEDFDLQQDDVRSRIVASFKQVGAARPIGRDRWALEFLSGAQMELLSASGREVVLAGATESEFGVMSHTARLLLPEGSSKPRVVRGGSALEFEYRPALEAGSSATKSFRLDAQPHLMSSLAAVHSNKDFVNFWAARSVFRNEGDQPLMNLRIRFRIANHSNWSEWAKTAIVYPGQTVIDPYFPVFDLDSVSRLNASRTAMIEAEYEYQTEAGETVKETEAARVELLSRNQAVFSSRQMGEATSWYEQNDYLPYVIAAFSTSDDPVVQQLAGRISGMAGGAAASLDSEAAGQFLQSLWIFMQHNRISYQTPPSLKVNQTFGQNIKYARDVLRNRAGTCIDLAIFWASVAKAVGLKAHVVAVPGHAFPVIQLPNGNLLPIEATLIGQGTLEQAVEQGLKNYQQAMQGAYLTIDVDAVQAQGVRCLDLPPVNDSWLSEMKYDFPELQSAQQVSYDESAQQQQQQPPRAALQGNPPPAAMTGIWETAFVNEDGREISYLFELDANGVWFFGVWSKVNGPWVRDSLEQGRLVLSQGLLLFQPNESEAFTRRYELSGDTFTWIFLDGSNRSLTFQRQRK